MDDADAGAALTGASGAAGAVGVVFDVVGESVVNDVRKVVDIKTAGSYVGSYEQLGVVLTELLHREVALGLRKVAMKGFGIVAVANEEVGNFLGFDTGAAKDDAVNAGEIVDNALEGGVLVLGMDEVINMVDVFGTFVARTDNDFL